MWIQNFLSPPGLSMNKCYFIFQKAGETVCIKVEIRSVEKEANIIKQCCFPCSQQGDEQEQGVRRAHARGAHKSGPFCPPCPPSQQGLDDPNSWGLIHQVAP